MNQFIMTSVECLFGLMLLAGAIAVLFAPEIPVWGRLLISFFPFSFACIAFLCAYSIAFDHY